MAFEAAEPDDFARAHPGVEGPRPSRSMTPSAAIANAGPLGSASCTLAFARPAAKGASTPDISLNSVAASPRTG